MLRELMPAVLPQYVDQRLSPYSDLPPQDARETADSIWFAPSLIRRIADTPNQEIATHTFSHYYCMEAGQESISFREDLRAACHVAGITGLTLRSLVFPRNQCAPGYLAIAQDAGITSYRGNPVSWLHQPTVRSQTRRLQRALRLADSYLNLAGSTSFPAPDPSAPRGDAVNIPASRFLRPYQAKLRRLETLRLRRIKHELTDAAERGLAYHLWWHPHNFGRDTGINIAFLTAILAHYRFLHDEYGMISMNMGEIADQLLKQPHAEQRQVQMSAQGNQQA
jgi:hypothetical protein